MKCIRSNLQKTDKCGAMIVEFRGRGLSVAYNLPEQHMGWEFARAIIQFLRWEPPPSGCLPALLWRN